MHELQFGNLSLVETLEIQTCLQKYLLPTNINELPELIPPSKIIELFNNDKKDGSVITLSEISNPLKIKLLPEKMISNLIPMIKLKSNINTKKTHRINLPSSKSETNKSFNFSFF